MNGSAFLPRREFPELCLRLADVHAGFLSLAQALFDILFSQRSRGFRIWLNLAPDDQPDNQPHRGKHERQP